MMMEVVFRMAHRREVDEHVLTKGTRMASIHDIITRGDMRC